MKPVWDLSLRIWHWGLVAIVIADHFFIEGGHGLHAWLGYFACLAIIARFVSPRKVARSRWLMLVFLFLLALTGWMHSWDRFFGDDWVVDLHNALSYGLLGLALVHVIDVIRQSFKKRRNLIASMIHGKRSEF